MRVVAVSVVETVMVIVKAASGVVVTGVVIVGEEGIV